MRLKSIEKSMLEKIRLERNEDISMLRTPFRLTEYQQEDWYKNVVSDRKSNFRFYAIEEDVPTYIQTDIIITPKIVGYGALDVQSENGIAEIGCLIFSEYRKNGYGLKAVSELLKEGFGNLRLDNIFGECYYCGALSFWRKIAGMYGAYTTSLPNRKYYNGRFWDSYYFNIYKQEIK